MGKFKKGDRVKALVNWCDAVAGEEYVVDHIDEGGEAHIKAGNGVWYMTDDEIELVRAADWQLKVGDRVRMIKDVDGEKADCGATVVLNDGTSTQPWRIEFDVHQEWATDNKWFVDADDIEPLPAAPVAAEAQPAAWVPKVGDRVVVVDNKNNSGQAMDEVYAVGGTYTVTGTGGFHDSWVLDDKGRFLWGKQIAPFRLEAGKFYKTRDGRKVGPMKYHMVDSKGVDRWIVVEGNGEVWLTDGKWASTIRDGADLIAEWVEPAVAPATAAPTKPLVAATVDYQADEYGSGVRQTEKTKFKVGDVVKSTGNSAGTKYEITNVRADEVYVVSLNEAGGREVTWGWYPASKFYHAANDNAPVAQQPVAKPKFKVGDLVKVIKKSNFGDAGSLHCQPLGREFTLKGMNVTGAFWRTNEGVDFYDDEIALVTSHKPTAIVARIDNGQPKPNPVPFVHHSQEAAATEAARLANKHKGQKFGVYVLTGEPAFVEKPTYAHEWQRLAANGNSYEAAAELRRSAGVAITSARRAVHEFLAAA